MPVGLVSRVQWKFSCLSLAGFICLTLIRKALLKPVRSIIHRPHLREGQEKPRDVKVALPEADETVSLMQQLGRKSFDSGTGYVAQWQNAWRANTSRTQIIVSDSQAEGCGNDAKRQTPQFILNRIALTVGLQGELHVSVFFKYQNSNWSSGTNGRGRKKKSMRGSRA